MSISLTPTTDSLTGALSTNLAVAGYTLFSGATGVTQSPGIYTGNYCYAWFRYWGAGGTNFSGTVNWAWSFDNTNWTSLTLQTDTTGTPSSGFSGTANSTSVNFYRGFIPNGAYIRAQITSYTSGAINIFGYLSNAPYPLSSISTTSVRSALTKSDGAIVISVDTANDGINTAQYNGPSSIHAFSNFNGSSFDRVRGDTRGLFVANAKFAESIGVTMQNASSTNINGNTFPNLDLNYTSALFKITGTFVATINFESSTDNITFNPLTTYNLSTNTTSTTGTAAGIFYTPLTTGTYYRARISGYTSGNVTVAFVLNNREVVTPNIDGIPASALRTAGLFAYNGTNYERIRTVNGVADGATTGLAAEGAYGWNGAGWDRVRVNNVHKYQEYLSLAAGTTYTWWTPVSGKKFRLMSILFGSSQATMLTLRDGGNNIATLNIGGRDTKDYTFGNNGYLSSATNNSLSIYNNSASTITFWLTVLGTEE